MIAQEAAPEGERPVPVTVTPAGIYALVAARLRSVAARLVVATAATITVYEVQRLLVDAEALAIDAGALEDGDLAQLAFDLGMALSGTVALSPLLLGRLSARCWAAESICLVLAGGAS